MLYSIRILLDIYTIYALETVVLAFNMLLQQSQELACSKRIHREKRAITATSKLEPLFLMS